MITTDDNDDDDADSDDGCGLDDNSFDRIIDEAHADPKIETDFYFFCNFRLLVRLQRSRDMTLTWVIDYWQFVQQIETSFLQNLQVSTNRDHCEHLLVVMYSIFCLCFVNPAKECPPVCCLFSCLYSLIHCMAVFVCPSTDTP